MLALVSTKPEEATLESIIDKLAEVLHDADEALEVARRAGFGPADLPNFKNAGVFWSRVVREADHGKTIGGVGAIVAQARARYPGNPFFAAYGGHAAREERASSGPTPDPADARRDVHGIELVLVPGGTFMMGSPDDDELAIIVAGDLERGPDQRQRRQQREILLVEYLRDDDRRDLRRYLLEDPAQRGQAGRVGGQ